MVPLISATGILTNAGFPLYFRIVHDIDKFIQSDIIYIGLMNTVNLPNGITVYSHQKRSFTVSPITRLCLAVALFVLVAALLVTQGLKVLDSSLKQPELLFSTNEVVVGMYDVNGKKHTPKNDPLFTQRVNRILKDGRYDKTYVGPDKK